MATESRNIPTGWAAWFRWFAVTLIGLIAGLVVFFIIGVTFGEFIDQALPEFVFGIILGTIFGTAFGVAHWLFLRRYVSGMGAWIPATVIAFALAAALIFGWLNPESAETSIPLKISHAIVVGLSLGFAQSLVLRTRLARAANLWILFSLGGWIIGEITGIVMQNLVEEPIPLMANFLVGGSVPGIGMIWLLKQPRMREPKISVPQSTVERN